MSYQFPYHTSESSVTYKVILIRIVHRSSPPSLNFINFTAVSSGDRAIGVYRTKGKMSSFSLDVPSPQKRPSEAKSVDSGYCGPSRETSTAALLRKSSELAIIPKKKKGIAFSMESLSSSLMSSSVTSITEEVISSETSQLQFFDHQRMSSIEASQPSVTCMHLTESHLPLQLTLSSSGSPSQINTVQITVTSSAESQSQPYTSNTCVAQSMKSRYTPSLTAEHEDILKRTVEKRTHIFTECTHFETLVPYLYEKKLVLPGECERLEQFSSQKAKGNHFYTVILPRNGKYAYRRLYKCLKRETEHLGHRDLVAILDKALEEHQSPQSSSDSSPTESNSADRNFATRDDNGDFNPLSTKDDMTSSSCDINSPNFNQDDAGRQSCTCNDGLPGTHEDNPNVTDHHSPCDNDPHINHTLPSHGSSIKGNKDGQSKGIPSNHKSSSHRNSKAISCCTVQ